MSEDPRIKAYQGNVVTLKAPDEQYGNWMSAGQAMGVGLIEERDRVGKQAASVLFGPSAKSASQYGKYGRILTAEQLWLCYQRVPDVRASVDAIVRRVATWDWVITPTVSPKDDDYAQLIDVCKKADSFLRAPNTDGETWQEVWTKAITDLLVFDAGALENVFGGKWDDDGVFQAEGDLQEIVALRGSTIYPIVDAYGHVEGYKQSYTGIDSTNLFVNQQEAVHDGTLKKGLFSPNQVVYMRLFPNTQSPLGTPIIESIVNEVITMLRQSEHTMLAMDANEIPPGILVLTGIAGNAAQAAMADLQNMKGKDHRIRVITTPDPKGSGAHWVELRHKAKDVDFVNVISNVRKTIFRVFGVMPVEMGLTSDMPKAVGQVQLDVSTSHLINPILELIEAKINARILPLVIGDDADLQRVKFTFDREAKLSPEQQREKALSLNTLIGQGVMTRNEARAELGLAPIENGDVMTITTGQGTFALEQIVSVSHTQPQEPPSEANPGTSSDIPDKPPEIYSTEDIRIKFSELPEKIQSVLREKSKDHNEEVGDDDRKRTTPSTLGNVYDRGVGAYHNNPASVRPTVKSPEQWGLARVNSFLFALRNLRFKSGKHDTDLLPKSHPMYSGDDKSRVEEAVGDVDPTNFPKAGDDLKVSLRNSNFETFDADYAKDLKDNYPEIWDKGGNIKGNEQYKDLTPVVNRGGVVENETEEAAVRLREAWSARHYEDYRLAGVVAQIKWYTVGTLGESGMKELINEQKKKIDESRSKNSDKGDSGCEHHHVHGSCSCSYHGPQDVRAKDLAGNSDLPSEWQNPGMFSDVRTIDLVDLHNVVVDYDKTVSPLYEKMKANIVADVSAIYRPGKLTDELAIQLIARINTHINRLEAEWSLATESFYVRAGDIGASSAAKFTGQPKSVEQEQSSLIYKSNAMSYLTIPGGLLNDLRVEMTLLISAMTTGSASQERAVYDVPDDVESTMELELAIATAAKTVEHQKFRIKNWSGKLVDLANKAMKSALEESNSVISDDPDGPAVVSAEWYGEWVSVGDARMCPTCSLEGSKGFRPLSSIPITPGGGTDCGARCRCVIVVWTKQEVLSGEASSFSNTIG